MLDNIILMTDGYKISHHLAYPRDTKTIYSYLESRGGAKYPATKFFGLRYIMQRYLTGQVVTKAKIDAAEKLFTRYFGNNTIFYRDGWQHILTKHDGRLPLRIRAVAENQLYPTGAVMMTVENTDSSCFWLTNYVETILTHVWYPSTVATQSHFMKQLIAEFLERSGTPESIDYRLHDFGYRGVSSCESAALGGAAHLLNFRGTDTVAGIEFLDEYYPEVEHQAWSCPATEHSTITSWGKEHELDAMRNFLEKFPSGVAACVSDSYNIYQACEKYWGTELRSQVLARDGVLSVRPDSGDPCIVLPKVLGILGDRFGYSTNRKGYKTLNDNVRVIQGDGIDANSLREILDHVCKAGWSADNMYFGSGGGLLQKVNRDTQRFAFKCSAIERSDGWHDVWKSPIDDHGKDSKRGRFSGEGLRIVFENGKVLA